MKVRYETEPVTYEHYTFWGKRKETIRWTATGFIEQRRKKDEHWWGDGIGYGDTEEAAIAACEEDIRRNLARPTGDSYVRELR